MMMILNSLIVDTYIKDMIWCINDNIHIDRLERQIAIIIVARLAGDDDLDDDDPE
jgi:hypothetical protein